MSKVVDSSYILGIIDGRRRVIEEVLEWLKEHCWRREAIASILMQDGPPSYEIVMNFESEEELFQSFKDRFNIE